MALKIDVLGTKYHIVRVKSGQDEYIERMHFGGYCDDVVKRIVLLDLKTVPEWATESEYRIKEQEDETLRHELIHAFLSESGLGWNSFAPEKAWAKNEEMVDWFAIQMPKLLKAFKVADCL
jgi:hypothetical protein